MQTKYDRLMIGLIFHSWLFAVCSLLLPPRGAVITHDEQEVSWEDILQARTHTLCYLSDYYWRGL